MWCGEEERRQKDRKKTGKALLEEQRGKALECFPELSTNTGVGLGAKVSQKGRCVVFGVFFGAVKGPPSRGAGFLNFHHLREASNRDVSDENVAKRVTRGCCGSPHFFEESKDRVV